MSTYFVYQNRNFLSWCPTVLMGAYLVFLSQPDALKIQPKYDQKPIEISLAEPIEKPKAAPVEKAKAEPIEKPKVAPVEKTKAEPIEKPKAAPVEKTKAEPIEKPKAAPVEKAKAEPIEKPKAAPVEKAKAEPIEKPKVVSNPSLESSYIQHIRSTVEEQKRYPTGREASLDRPEGNVEIWLEIDRSGNVLDSGISSKSKSMLLNRAALSSLQSIKKVKPFPSDAFIGENQNKFVATLNYSAP